MNGKVGMNVRNTPLRKMMCATCPFRDGSPYAYIADDLAASAINQASRICHSTGSNNGINRRTGLPPHLCRGARDIQLQVFASLGVIVAPTDEAWDDGRERIGLKRTIVSDPVKERSQGN